MDPPIIPTAGFFATPISVRAPLEVANLDESTGNPTGWMWDFGDGSASTARDPLHVYMLAGSHDITLTVTGDGRYPFALLEGSTNSARYSSREGFEPPQLVLTFDTTMAITMISVADGQVRSSNPTTNYGEIETLRIRGGSPAYTAYLRFEVTGAGSQFLDSAKLRLFTQDGSRPGGDVYFVAGAWDEQSLTSGNAPALVGGPIGSADMAVSGVGWSIT